MNLDHFASALRDVTRSRQLTDRVTALLRGVDAPVLDLYYEELLYNQTATMARIGRFLGVFDGDFVDRGGYRKATPDRLCAAIANYGEFCRAFVGTPHERDFDEACDTRCGQPGLWSRPLRRSYVEPSTASLRRFV